MALAVSVPARWQARVPRRVTRRPRRVDKKRTSSFASASPSSPGEADASAPQPASAPSRPSGFFAGVGVGDCTGPMDGVGMMGYARVSQVSSGMRQRQRARAFVVAESLPSFLRDANGKEHAKNDPARDPDLVALVVVDACMVFPDLKPVVLAEFVKRLEAASFAKKTGAGANASFSAAGVVDEANLCLCATHTHSAPGGYAPHGLYNLTLGGGVSESFDALAKGAADALFEAFADAFQSGKKSTVAFARGELKGISANRSRAAFDLNPTGDTEAFALRGGVDETVSALVVGALAETESANLTVGRANETKKKSARGVGEVPRGVASWYAVHGTSLPGSNTLISGDNKGIASFVTESALRSAAAGDDSAVRALVALFRSLDGETEDPFSRASGGEKKKSAKRGLADADAVARAASAAARVATVGFERRFRDSASSRTDSPGVVAAFPQSASGDVSPNVLGAHDATRGGAPCDGSDARTGFLDGFLLRGTPRVADCVGLGLPGTEQSEDARFLSCLVTGTAQAAACASLLDAAEPVSGPVRAAARWVPIGRKGGAVVDGRAGSLTSTLATSTPALGYAFAAGTTDGPGENGFKQGDRESVAKKKPQRFLGRVATFLFGGSKKFGVAEETRVAHAPKPVLAAFPDVEEAPGRAGLGWVQRDVQVQVFRLGRVLIASIPAEVTTVAGKRLEEAAARAARVADSSIDGWSVVVNGLANGYSGYVTTAEEYEAQRYEGASTLYGPNTLTLYERVVAELVREVVRAGASARGSRVSSIGDGFAETRAREPYAAYRLDPNARPADGPQSVVFPFDARWPPWVRFGEQLSFHPGLDEETRGRGERGGRGGRVVRVGARGDAGEARVAFLAGRPRRCAAPPPNGTFLVVERFDPSLGEWHVIADDDDMSTIVEWDAHGPLWLASRLALRWRPPAGTAPGTHRVGVAGAARTVSGALASFIRSRGEKNTEDALEFFRGFSEPFEVLAGKEGGAGG